MCSKFLFGLVTLACISAVATPAAAQIGNNVHPAPATDRLIRLKKQIRSGILPNGFRYVIAAMPDEADAFVQLKVAVGYVDAPKDINQLPHVLEHVLVRDFSTPRGGAITQANLLAAWGPPGDRIKASTNARETFYAFQAPGSDFQNLAIYVRSLASGRGLHPEDIRRETRIAYTEMLREPSERSPLGVAMRAFMMPSPEGSPEDKIKALNRIRPAQVMDFYKRHYRAEKMTLYIGGKIDPVAAEARVRALFSDIPSGAPAQPVLPMGVQDLSRGAMAFRPYLDASTSTLLLDYGAGAAGTTRARAVRLVLGQLIQEQLDRRTSEVHYPILKVGVVSDHFMWRNAPSGLDITYAAPIGSFAAASEEVVATLQKIASGAVDPGSLQAIREQQGRFAQSSPEEACLRMGNVMAGIITADNAGRFGDMDCEDLPSSADFNAVTAKDVENEMRRLLDPTRMGFFSVTRTGDREPSLTNFQAALKATSTVRLFSSRPAATQPINDPERVIGNISATNGRPPIVVTKDISRIDDTSMKAIYFHTPVQSSSFTLRIFGAPIRNLPVEVRHFAKTSAQIIRSSGFGGLSGKQTEEFLDKAGIHYEVRVDEAQSLIEVSGPRSEFAAGLNMLAHILRGPVPEQNAFDMARRRASIAVPEDREIFDAIVSNAVNLNIPPPVSWRVAMSSESVPDAPTVHKIWEGLFGRADQLVVVARGGIDPPTLAAGLAAVAASLPAPGMADAKPQEPRVLEAVDRHFVMRRGYGLASHVQILVPLLLGEADDPVRAADALRAAFGGRTRFFERIRVIEAGAYSPSVTILPDPIDKGRLFLVIDFVCDPEDTNRLADAIWDEVRQIRKSGLSAAEAARVDQLRTRDLPLPDESIAAQALASANGMTATSRPASLAAVATFKRLFSTAARRDLIIFEARP